DALPICRGRDDRPAVPGARVPVDRAGPAVRGPPHARDVWAMIGGALKLARGAWELAGRALGAAGEWLRRPRDWWRVVAFGLALVGGGFAFAVADTKRDILLVREQCQTRIITVERQAEKAVAAANTSRAGLQQCKARLEEEVGRAARAAELERE